MSSDNSTTTPAVEKLAGKYLTFRIGEEEYGLEILKVREIIGLMDITPVPRTPVSIRGVINLRGRIIPVLNLRVKFEMSAIEDTDETCIIVVETSSDGVANQMGILVDTVSEVLDIVVDELEPTPSFGEGVDSDFILGIAKCKGSVKILLNTERILDTDGLRTLNEAS
ncbi:chemotaxis protein CheW [Engelhardtia mirabilis]|uniref:Chemotaxis protein CheW n=1 Tax=Engelhardtia mirabilis TaxID=2528011 RepID=A0A518BSB6_9BACT|nr:Chemotaxis protein CheW [Planctomycetes bacterium Pla133]QDV04193.1 Chemotaxis protein CheW [Planctomycetes bacterium Pla86]